MATDHQPQLVAKDCYYDDGVYSGGRAQRVAVLSADVLRNEKSVGCHLPEITLSAC